MNKLEDVRCDVCKKCGFYNKLRELCDMEKLPIMIAISRNEKKLGKCKNISEYKEKNE